MMSNFRTVHDLEEEQLPPGKGLPGLEILSLLAAEEMDRFSARLVSFPANSVSPPTYHRAAREIVYVLAGSGEFEVGGESRQCGPGTVIHVPPGAVHVIRTKDEPVRFLAIEGPPVRLGGDIVFLEDER